MNPLFTETGSLIIGDSYIMSRNVTWPWGKLTVYPDSVVMEITGFPRLLGSLTFVNSRTGTYPVKVRRSFREIIAVELRTFLFDLVRFKHENAEYPPYIGFGVGKRKTYEKLVELHRVYWSQC